MLLQKKTVFDGWPTTQHTVNQKENISQIKMRPKDISPRTLLDVTDPISQIRATQANNTELEVRRAEAERIRVVNEPMPAHAPPTRAHAPPKRNLTQPLVATRNHARAHTPAPPSHTIPHATTLAHAQHLPHAHPKPHTITTCHTP